LSLSSQLVELFGPPWHVFSAWETRKRNLRSYCARNNGGRDFSNIIFDFSGGDKVWVDEE
jgi:hypothetical protein